MEAGTSKRITYKRAWPNPIFQEWLEELYSEAQTKKSKLTGMLGEALDSMSKYPLPLNSGAECAILKGFDKNLCLFLDKRLEAYKILSQIAKSTTGLSVSSTHSVETSKQNIVTSNQKSLETPQSSTQNTQTSNGGSQTDNTELNQNSQRKNIPKPYIPAYRSGGYAILVALFEFSKENPNYCFINKGDLIELAQKHCDESFVRPKPETYYTAWSNMATLIEKRLVFKMQTHRIEYALTLPGYHLAKLLYSGEKICDDDDIILINNDFQQSSGSHSITENAHKVTETAPVVTIAASKVTVAASKVTVAASKVTETAPKVTKTAPKVTETAPKATETVHEVTDTAPKVTETLHKVTENAPKEMPGSRSGKENAIASTSSQTEIDMVELPADSYDIYLLIDKCETGGVTKKNDPMVAQINKYPEMLHDYRSLKVGDFTWIAKHKFDPNKEIILPYIIERKRMDDLAASIKDGRFHEQKFRLKKCKLENVIYLVEYNRSKKHIGFPLKNLMQAIANTRVVDGFLVHVTDSLTETVRFLAMMYKRLSIDFKDKTLKGCNSDPQNGTLMTFDYFNKLSAKNKSLTVRENFIKLLLQIKGISVEKALALTNDYPTPASLIQAYQDCSKDEGLVLLSKKKIVGPTLSAGLYHLFTTHPK